MDVNNPKPSFANCRYNTWRGKHLKASAVLRIRSESRIIFPYLACFLSKGDQGITYKGRIPFFPLLYPFSEKESCINHASTDCLRHFGAVCVPVYQIETLKTHLPTVKFQYIGNKFLRPFIASYFHFLNLKVYLELQR